MNSEELIKPETIKQKIELVKGAFTPSEASHIIMSLIDEKINFHKIQRLQQWEGNHNCNTDALDDRIKQLEKEKEIARDFIAKTRSLKGKLKINGVLEITVDDIQ
jgi:DNA-binding HxlR family transcriptional regulator